MHTAKRVVLALLVPLSWTSQVAAQTDNHLAIGGSVTSRLAGSSVVTDTASIGVLWRLGHGDRGWGWQYGFNWYETDARLPIGGVTTELGQLHIRPFMGGYGYTWPVGKASVTAALLGGYAFASFRLEPKADDEYRARLGALSVSAAASNAFVAKPELKIWYDLNEKIGLLATTGYIVARPTVTVTSSLGEDKRAIRADMFMFKVGVVYSIF
jgi:hypothetical protein